MTLLVLGLFLITGVAATSDTTTTSTPSRHQATTTAATTATMTEEERRVFDFEHLQANLGGQQQQQQQKLQRSTTDRRVIPWVSIAVLLNILFFFRSIAAPFFDPLVSTILTYLYDLARLAVWTRPEGINTYTRSGLQQIIIVHIHCICWCMSNVYIYVLSYTLLYSPQF